MPASTLEEHKKMVEKCKAIFTAKNKDYGTAWRILRLPTLTDQIMIKAERIRTLQRTTKQMVSDDIHTELIGIVNYAIIALIQIELAKDTRLDLPSSELMTYYDKCVARISELLKRKNHDYGEAWRSMRVSSMIDLILMKLLRIKSIEDLEGEVTVSEGIHANYEDIVNYAIFSLIRLNP